jgi:uncharacterized protein DUF6263
MHSRKILLVVALLSAWSLAALPASAQTTLRYKFKDGENLKYVVEQKMKMTMSIMGKDIDMNMDQSSEMTWAVGKVDDKGNAQINVKFGRSKMNMTSPMGKVEVDSNSTQEPEDQLGQILYKVVKGLSDMEVSATVSPLGEFSDLKIPEKALKALQNIPGGEAFGDMLSPDGLKRMMSQSGLVMPKEPVTAGKTWNTKNEMKLPFGKMVAEIEYKYAGPVEKEGKTFEKIFLKPKADIQPGKDAPIAMKVKSQEGKGTALFDNTAGRLIEVTNQQNMEMEAENMGIAFTMRMTQATTMRLVDKK